MSSFFPDSPDPSHSPAPHSREEPRLLTRRDEVSAAAAPEPRLQRRRAMEDHYGPSRVETSGRGRRARTILVVALVLVILTAGALAGIGIWLRHAMHAALPKVDGTLQTAGLSAAVTVTRDEHGVPSIQAATLDDLLFAQGFVTAQDRLWQMDALRRHAAGELAEIMGSKLIEHDRTQRTLQVRAAADRAVAVLPPDQMHQLQAYARGVNAFIAQSGDHLPLEFHLLHYAPAPWTPRDTLLVSLAMAQDLSTSFPTKLMREAFSTHLAPELLTDLYPVGSWRDHPPSEDVPDLTSPRPEILQIPLDPSQSRISQPAATPHDLLATQEALFLQTCDGCRSGSNNWAVAGSRSASGHPLVSNDMHLALGVPGVWYEAALHSADGAIDVTGLTLPGTPFVIVGRNAHVAWSFTNLGADVQDIYIEHLRGTGDTTEYQRADGSWTIVEHHSEPIRVRGGRDVTLDVMTTSHSVGAMQMPTPIISPLYPSEHRTLSLAWTAYDPANVTSIFLAANTAVDGGSLAAAFTNFGGPSLNLIYADDHNHIGYHAVGRMPVRGLAIHHPIVALPEAPPVAEPGSVPANEDDSAADLQPSSFIRLASPPMFMNAAYRPRRRVPTRPRSPVKSAPELEAPLPAPVPALGYTIGSPIAAVPVDGLDPNVQWSGYIPFGDLPAVIDPASGFLATANARIVPRDYPYAIALNWAAPYRVERISHLLANSTGLVPADMLRIQMDVHSELDQVLARRMAYALDHTTHNTARLHQAADILRRWNGDVTVDAAAPAIVAAARAELWPMLLLPKISAHDRAAGVDQKTVKPEGVLRLYSWAEQGYVLEQLVLHTPARWLPSKYANWNDLLAAAVDKGLTNGHAPGNLATWSYSKEHPVALNHPLLSANPLLSRLLGVAVGSGPHVVAGDTSTINATARSFGPSERFTADMSSTTAATSNITTGQSGNPASPWYLDQLPHWLAGTTLPLPLHDAQVSHTLVLQP